MALLALGAARQAQRKKYTFALVPKNMNNPFFDQARDGCKKAEKELERRDRVPVYRTRRAWRRRRAGAGRQRPHRQEGRRHRRVALERRGHGQGARRREGGGHPGPDLGLATCCDKDKALRVAYVGTYNYDIGVNLAKLAQQIKPKGGTICIQSGGAAAANHNERMQGIRDTLAGKKSARRPATS